MSKVFPLNLTCARHCQHLIRLKSPKCANCGLFVELWLQMRHLGHMMWASVTDLVNPWQLPCVQLTHADLTWAGVILGSYRTPFTWSEWCFHRRQRALVEKLGIAVQNYNPSTKETEVGGSGVLGHPWRHSDFEASLGYTKPCLKNCKNKLWLTPARKFSSLRLHCYELLFCSQSQTSQAFKCAVHSRRIIPAI